MMERRSRASALLREADDPLNLIVSLEVMGSFPGPLRSARENRAALGPDPTGPQPTFHAEKPLNSMGLETLFPRQKPWIHLDRPPGRF
jgi:hypothetical protein